ncbi:hypothetical protein [Streptomyces niveus]|uniref:hypothetical protein n=1 Tax=Streptomyces niveus TaxID=193462 RepID=UPI003F4EC717
MKAVAIRAFGGPEGLAVVDLPAPAPTAGQVVITTEATGVSGADALTAITDSGGAVHAATDDELLAARALLTGYGVQPTAAASAGLAGLLAHARTTPVSGNQIVVLTGR